MEQKRVKIAVVGLGRMGKRHVHTLLYRVPFAQVVAVCTNMPHEIEWAQQNEEYKDFGITLYEDYDKMLGHSDLDAVWVSTSTDVHASQTLAAMKHGKHVLCEKPLSTDLDEAQKVVDAAKGYPDLKVMAGFSRRFDDSYRDAAKKILEDRTIGKPFLERRIFVDCAIHDIDLTLWYPEDPSPKSCWATGTLQHHPELEMSKDVDNAVGVVEFWGGKIAYFLCSRTQAHGHDVCTEVTGTEGKVAINGLPRDNNVVVCDKRGMTHEVQPEYWQRFEHAFATEANEFITAILKHKPVPLPLELGQKVMQIARALQDALWTGEVSRWDEHGVRL
ncbi:hypothetical protein LTR36_009448 [Oleoguttula mirabilis]|uniref:Uncharacterized protein n=1 Tax=Oleoguttula mirabilis TaxID=1507867 RepID=A0AAV9JST5_9PEZI|nr:hypothetical protein LTR36_009448 [Oleoguttula mirabilis]